PLALRAPSSPLFPYTTLFRSEEPGGPDERPESALAAAPSVPKGSTGSARVGLLARALRHGPSRLSSVGGFQPTVRCCCPYSRGGDRKSTRLNSSHDQISYAVF